MTHVGLIARLAFVRDGDGGVGVGLGGWGGGGGVLSFPRSHDLFLKYYFILSVV